MFSQGFKESKVFYCVKVVIPSIPWALCLFILFMALSTYFLCKLGHFFCVWSWFHCTFWRGHCFITEWFVEICAYSLNFFSDIFSTHSFLILIIICLFLCLLICLGPFLASISCINFFLFLLALVCFFFTNLLSSAYSTLSFRIVFAFCCSSSLFLYKLSVYVSSVLFLNMDFCVSFCMVSIDFLRILFIFSKVGSLSFKASNLFY